MNSNTKTITLMDLPGQYHMLSKEINKAIEDVLLSGRYVLGKNVEVFEKEFAKFSGAKYCVGTSSGFASLYLSLLAIDIKVGDEVITVPNTFTATAEAIVLAGAKPVFCDVKEGTYNLDPKKLEKLLNKKTKAVIPVHLHGNPSDMDQILKVCKEKGIFVIEDAAQAHGALYKGKKIGSLKSELTCFSFHPVKNLGAIGDAGAITTNNKKLAEKIRLLINHGRSKHNEHIMIGTTNRMDELQAAILLIKLKKLKQWLSQRRRLANYYVKNLRGSVTFMYPTDDSVSSHHVFAIFHKDRNKLAAYLKANNIETGMHYPTPLHLQKAYEYLGYKRGDFPVSEEYANTTLSLPFFPHMSFDDADYVISKVKEFLQK